MLTICRLARFSGLQTVAHFRIRNSAGNRQLNLSSCSGFAPEIQLRPDALCALTHSRKPPVSGASADSGIDAFSVVANSQPKLILVVMHFDFNPACLSMVK